MSFRCISIQRISFPGTIMACSVALFPSLIWTELYHFVPLILILLVIASIFGKSRVEEKIVLFPHLGVQLEDSSGRSDFYPIATVDSFCCNESFERCRVVFYLLMVTQGKLVILFDRTRPSPRALLPVFKALDDFLDLYASKDSKQPKAE